MIKFVAQNLENQEGFSEIDLPGFYDEIKSEKSKKPWDEEIKPEDYHKEQKEFNLL